MARTARKPRSSANHVRHSRFVLISSRMPQPRRGLQYLLEDPSPTSYVSLVGKVTSLDIFLEQALQTLQEQILGPDSRLRQTLDQDEQRPERLAEALLRDLDGRVQRLIIDGFDQMVPDDRIQRFITYLSEGDPASLQIVVYSRVLDRRLWGSLLRNQTALVLGEDTPFPAHALASEQVELPQLEVYAFRGGVVYVDGLPITNWEGPLVRGLFFYLVDHPLVTRDEIFDIFWPRLSTKEATNVFHVTKRKITECLGLELTDYQAGFYRPATGYHLHYDVAAFEATPDTEIGYKTAVGLHRHPFLSYLDTAWIRQRRQELQARYVERLLDLARLYRANGQNQLSILYYSRAQQHTPEREDIARVLMELYTADGRPKEAVQVYERLGRTLHDQFRIQPSTQTRQAYEALIATA